MTKPIATNCYLHKKLETHVSNISFTFFGLPKFLPKKCLTTLKALKRKSFAQSWITFVDNYIFLVINPENLLFIDK
jgi:hypothetical protein